MDVRSAKWDVGMLEWGIWNVGITAVKGRSVERSKRKSLKSAVLPSEFFDLWTLSLLDPLAHRHSVFPVLRRNFC